MASHVVFKIWRLQQLALEEVISVDGVKQERNKGVKNVRRQLAGVHQDSTDYIWTYSSTKGRETLLSHHLRHCQTKPVCVWCGTCPEQSIEAILVVQPLVHWLGHISLQADLQTA